VGGALLLAVAGWTSAGPARATPTELRLTVVRACDERLPAPTDADLQEIFTEATRILSRNFGVEPFWVFVDSGTRALQGLFAGDYNETAEFREWENKYQYPPDGAPDFEAEKARIVAFLSEWSLAELNRMTSGGRRIRTYDDAFKIVTSAYARRIEDLKNLRLKNGEFLYRRPPAPWQSLLHWRGMMSDQNEYDVFITNALVASDIFVSPSPHSILKEAKISGAVTLSPARENSLGHTTMVSVLEEYTDIPGFHDEMKALSRSEKNRIAGSTLAHELGHAVFYVPDVYDHGSACVMNSSAEILSHRTHYEHLRNAPGPCARCAPYAAFRGNELNAESAVRRRNYREGAALFLRAAETMPDRLLTTINRKNYLKTLYQSALTAYRLAGDEAGMQAVRDRWDERE
jgi:hypothetical protein